MSDLWGPQCVRLKVTVKSDNCGENAQCSEKGICLSNPTMVSFDCILSFICSVRCGLFRLTDLSQGLLNKTKSFLRTTESFGLITLFYGEKKEWKCRMHCEFILQLRSDLLHCTHIASSGHNFMNINVAKN